MIRPALAFVLAYPLVAPAQPPVVGFIDLQAPDKQAVYLEWFREGLRELGHEEGRTFVLVHRFAHGDNARFPALAREVLERNPAVVFSTCGPAQRAIRQVSRTVPLVAGCADERNFLGEVASLRRPGGATTGFTVLAPESVTRRLQILRELRPGLTRVGFLYHDGDQWDNYWREIHRGAPELSFELVRLPFKGVDDLDSAMALALKERCGALVAFPDATTMGAADRIAAFALKHRLASAFDYALFADAGGLFSYGVSFRDLYQRVGPRYVDRILKGARAGDLPVEQPTKFDLVINAGTARALGVTIPESLLVRADRVIE